MLQTAPLGRALPAAPVHVGPAAERATDNDLRCAVEHLTPRPGVAIKQLASRVLTGTVRAKTLITWGVVSFGLWMLGTALALVLIKVVPAWGSTPILVLGFGGLGAGLVSGALSIQKRRIEARAIAREGQLVVGAATYQRAQDTLGSELGDMLATPLGETLYCIAFAIGFIKHEVWVVLPSAPFEGEPHHVLVQPGARHALVFDPLGHAHAGELHRV